MTALALHDVSVSLGGRQVLSNISLDFQPGECVGIMGPNGSGKSTLMRTAAGLIAATSGRIGMRGRSLADWTRRDFSRELAFLPQGGQVHWPLSVRNVVALGRLPHAGSMSRQASADEAAISRAMTACDIGKLADRPVTALSGGERARVLLARALAGEAAILLADEPFAQLDPSHQLHAMEVLRAEAARGALVIVVLHDLSIAARHCSRVVLLSDGKVAADGFPADILSSENLRRTFGVDAFIGEHAGAPVILPLRRRA
jgi:iron complex transport system ATP-binding protein